MNIQNIKDLQNQLSVLGFKNLESDIVKKICFKPDIFISFYEIQKGKDRLNFDLHFEKNKEKDTYRLVCYDASILKEIVFNHTVINDVDTALLEKTMASIDWKTVAAGSTSEAQDPLDNEQWENAILIETIVEDLQKLEEDEEGKTMAYNLKLKYWSGIPFLEQMGSFRPLRNKQEVSQRFYLNPAQTGISIDEAHRFLQNMFIEKQLQLSRKSGINDNSDSPVPFVKQRIRLKKHPVNTSAAREVNRK